MSKSYSTSYSSSGNNRNIDSQSESEEVISLEELKEKLEGCGYEYTGNFPEFKAPVYKVKHYNSDVEDVVKLISLDVKQKHNKYLEIDIPSRISHPYIIRNLNVISTSKCKFGTIGVINTLGDHSLEDHKFDLDTTSGMNEYIICMYKIAKGIEFLHQCRILHLDIKTDNVIIYKGEPQIIDFGLASIICDTRITTPTGFDVGTWGYMAPEIFASDSKSYSVKSDVWSFLMLMYSIAAGYKIVHFVKRQPAKILEEFSDTKKQETINIHIIQDNLREFFEEAIELDPSKRKTMSEILEMSLFKRLVNRIPIYGSLKTDGSIQGEDTGTHKDYPLSLEDGIKLIYYVYISEYGYVNAMCLFYTLEILYRTMWATKKAKLMYYNKYYPLYREFIALCGAAIVIGLSSDFVVDIDVSTIVPLINEFLDLDSKNRITAGDVKAMQDSIIDLLKGKLYMSNLFDSCDNSIELMFVLTLLHINPTSPRRNFSGFRAEVENLYETGQYILLGEKMNSYIQKHEEYADTDIQSKCLTVEMALLNVEIVS